MSDRKVTLSTRVLPEQKLIIAEQAKAMGMSPSQYIEAKILRKDVFPMEKKIEKQRVEIERLKAQLFRREKEMKEELSQQKTIYKKKINMLQNQVEQAVSQNESNFIIPFSDRKQLEAFSQELQWLAEKYNQESIQSSLKVCVQYALKNARSSFFTESVSSFINENYTV